MNWPSMFGVNAANSDQLFDWYRWLQDAKSREEEVLWNRILERCKKVGIFESTKYRELSQDATAHHEAGHAVIAIALGVPVTHVEILSDQDGKCCYAKSPSTEDEKKDAVVCAMAGQWAEARLSARGFCPHCSEKDNQKADWLLKELCEGKTQHYRQWLEQQLQDRVVEEVEKHRQSIERVAGNLRAKGKLTGEQVKNLSLTAD